ncbi:MAG: DMT family transporter [Tissierellales bacterium]|jgi:transporter family-2 protein|nr:DMT family transporter [Tissierellales bacterium]
MILFAIIVSLLAGVFIVLSRILGATLSMHTGLIQGSFIHYSMGLLTSILFFIFSIPSIGNIKSELPLVPIWAYFGGAAGIFVVLLSNYITHKISAFYLTLLIFIGQIFSGSLIDYFTLNEFSIGKIIGGLLVLFGLTYNLWIDRINEKLATN